MFNFLTFMSSVYTLAIYGMGPCVKPYACSTHCAQTMSILVDSPRLLHIFSHTSSLMTIMPVSCYNYNRVLHWSSNLAYLAAYLASVTLITFTLQFLQHVLHSHIYSIHP